MSDIEHLYEKIKDALAHIIEGGKPNMVELRRIRWSIYTNLVHWFDNWKDKPVELGFAKHTPEIGEYGNEVSEV
eukprot:10636127-Ditylum_brightwellii.AAC.2